MSYDTNPRRADIDQRIAAYFAALAAGNLDAAVSIVEQLAVRLREHDVDPGDLIYVLYATSLHGQARSNGRTRSDGDIAGPALRRFLAAVRRRGRRQVGDPGLGATRQTSSGTTLAAVTMPELLHEAERRSSTASEEDPT